MDVAITDFPFKWIIRFSWRLDFSLFEMSYTLDRDSHFSMNPAIVTATSLAQLHSCCWGRVSFAFSICHVFLSRPMKGSFSLCPLSAALSDSSTTKRQMSWEPLRAGPSPPRTQYLCQGQGTVMWNRHWIGEPMCEPPSHLLTPPPSTKRSSLRCQGWQTGRQSTMRFPRELIQPCLPYLWFMTWLTPGS